MPPDPVVVGSEPARGFYRGETRNHFQFQTAQVNCHNIYVDCPIIQRGRTFLDIQAMLQVGRTVLEGRDGRREEQLHLRIKNILIGDIHLLDNKVFLCNLFFLYRQKLRQPSQGSMLLKVVNRGAQWSKDCQKVLMSRKFIL